MAITTSEAAATSTGDPAHAAPAATTSAAFSRVRFQTVTGKPALKSAWLIGRPIKPIPINPIRCIIPFQCSFVGREMAFAGKKYTGGFCVSRKDQ